jgi:transcriptional regulator with XRE-family HTH domain
MFYKDKRRKGINMTIEHATKKLIFLLDINQRKLATLLDVDTTLINLYFKGKRKPGNATLAKISKLIKERNLDMSIEEFLS